ncbi:hypothetical protein [Nonomuraea rubra]|uniref:hypothetical protein n=1 Tax=Nonomuraea rubra TaxID=46180 RepID=UPI0031F0927D
MLFKALVVTAVLPRPVPVVRAKVFGGRGRAAPASTRRRGEGEGDHVTTLDVWPASIPAKYLPSW